MPLYLKGASYLLSYAAAIGGVVHLTTEQHARALSSTVKMPIGGGGVLLRIFELFKLLIGQGCKPCLSISYDFLEDSLCLPGLGGAKCQAQARDMMLKPSLVFACVHSPPLVPA
jgi:hypothetical protein